GRARLRPRARPLDRDPRAAGRDPSALAGSGLAYSWRDAGRHLDPDDLVSPSRPGRGQTLTPSTAVTPEEFLNRLARAARGTMIESHGTRFVSGGAGRARAQLHVKASIT